MSSIITNIVLFISTISVAVGVISIVLGAILFISAPIIMLTGLVIPDPIKKEKTIGLGKKTLLLAANFLLVGTGACFAGALFH